MVKEQQYGDGLVRHYSDRGLKILQNETGIVYSDAIDVVPCKYSYVETDEPIESDITPEELMEELEAML